MTPPPPGPAQAAAPSHLCRAYAPPVPRRGEQGSPTPRRRSTGRAPWRRAPAAAASPPRRRTGPRSSARAAGSDGRGSVGASRPLRVRHPHGYRKSPICASRIRIPPVHRPRSRRELFLTPDPRLSSSAWSAGPRSPPGWPRPGAHPQMRGQPQERAQVPSLSHRIGDCEPHRTRPGRGGQPQGGRLQQGPGPVGEPALADQHVAVPWPSR